MTPSTKVILGKVYDRFISIQSMTDDLKKALDKNNIIELVSNKPEPPKKDPVLTKLAEKKTAPDTPKKAIPIKKAEEKKITPGSFGSLLVIDDDENTQNLLQLSFKKAGVKVISRTDPLKAIDDLEDISPDYILLDLMMPQMNGYEVLTKIRSNAKLDHIQIIVGSSRSFDKDQIAVLEMGANDFIAKPYDTKLLIKRVRNLYSDRKN